MYNSDKWISQTLFSVIHQTYKPIEIIVVDDGSKDTSLKIVSRLSNTYKNIKIYSQVNSGASAARNLGLKYSSGDYIQWLDADDILDANKIKYQIDEVLKIKDTYALFSSSWGRFFYQWNKIKVRPSSLYQNNLSPREWIISYFVNGEMMANCAWLVSRELTNAAGNWDTKLTLNDDGEYFFRIVTLSNSIQYISKSLSYYRSGNYSSLSWNKSKDSYLSLRNSVFSNIDLALSYDSSSEMRNASCILLNRIMVRLYSYGADSYIIDSIKNKISVLGGDSSINDDNASHLIGRLFRKLNFSYVFYAKYEFYKFIDYILYLYYLSTK